MRSTLIYNVSGGRKRTRSPSTIASRPASEAINPGSDRKRFTAAAISSATAVSGKRRTTIPEYRSGGYRRISAKSKSRVRSAAPYCNACLAICSSVADARPISRANSTSCPRLCTTPMTARVGWHRSESACRARRSVVDETIPAQPVPRRTGAQLEYRPR
jgi:hypothetical protein